MKNYFPAIISGRKIPLTIGLIVYNEEKYIGEAIESLLTQTYKDFILIISDNASTDRTPQICRYYAERDERIIYVRHKENRGTLFSFRYILERTNTPFFMFCGGHDRWSPFFIEKLLPAFREKNLILSYPRSREIKMDGTLGEIYRDNYTTVGIDRAVDRYLYLLRRIRACNIIHGIWLTQALKNCNLARTIGGDHIILLQAAFEGKFKQNNGILFFRRENRKNESQRDRLLRQFANIAGEKFVKKRSVFLLEMSFIFENMKVPFRKRYSLGIITKLWLIMNIFFVYTLSFFVKPALDIILKKLLPEKTYFKLKSIWEKIR